MNIHNKFAFSSIVFFSLAACGSAPTPDSKEILGTFQQLDTTNDPDNCGEAGYACVGGRACVASRCAPAWLPLETDGAPSPRAAAAAVYDAADNAYLITGGCDSMEPETPSLASTAYYLLDTDEWVSGEDMAAGRSLHMAVNSSAGSFVFGGLPNCWSGASILSNLEGSADMNDVWTSLDASGNPEPRYNGSMAWTGSSVFVYGGSSDISGALASGGIFTPDEYGGSWADASCNLDLCERGGPYEIFEDDGAMLIWGGGGFGDAPMGLEYDLTLQEWSHWEVAPGTPDFSNLTASFGPPNGGGDDTRRFYLMSDGKVMLYYPYEGDGIWVVDNEVSPPEGFCPNGPSVWTGHELVAWSGYCGESLSAVGGRYQPPADEAYLHGACY